MLVVLLSTLVLIVVKLAFSSEMLLVLVAISPFNPVTLVVLLAILVVLAAMLVVLLAMLVLACVMSAIKRSTFSVSWLRTPAGLLTSSAPSTTRPM